ncbi:permease [Roseovarius aestuariivivens]|uniref:permease n=1 Tax=Roseovarius aestuariivivens TaxID=1888910 RepID=UPI001081CD28|nr:permease [Roseovarius aestuariivivens]
MDFLQGWADAALTSLGFFWVAFWAFGLGYLISAAIQLFVSRDRMQQAMGDENLGSVSRAAVFGFLSSSCSFSALASARALFAKGAGFVPSMAFLLASTNLVIELGIVISVFLSWHFVVAEYVGGLVLIGVMWALVALWRPQKQIEAVRHALEAGDADQPEDPADLAQSPALWRKLAKSYLMEWQMVWKDVTVGFTVAGIIAAFVPADFFTWLFPGTGEEGSRSFAEVLSHAVIGPVAAFFTFIGSMGNIPLAGLLFANGVSVAGIMAFIFSDLVVFPVIRVHARFYGWKMAAYIAALFLAALVLTALAIHYGFALLGLDPQSASRGLVEPTERFQVDYTSWMNLAFLGLTAVFGWLAWQGREGHDHDHDHDHDHGGGLDRVLYWLALLAFGWLAGGLAVFALT